MATAVQLLGIAGACAFAFFLGWAVGGLAVCVALVVVGVAAERDA